MCFLSFLIMVPTLFGNCLSVPVHPPKPIKRNKNIDIDINPLSKPSGMKLGDFKKSLTNIENLNRISSNACDSSCDTDCDSSCDSSCNDSCDILWTWGCDSDCDDDCNESCNGGCDDDCGDYEGEEIFTQDIETNGTIIINDIENNTDIAILSYDCYDENYLYLDSLYSIEYIQKYGKINPHIIKKIKLIDTLILNGYTYNDHRRKRLKKLSTNTINKYFSHLNNNTHSFYDIIDTFDFDNNKIHTTDDCDAYWIDYYNNLQTGFNVIINSLNYNYSSGITIGIGFDESWIFVSYAIEVGIAISAKGDIGFFISESSSYVLLEIGYSYFSTIGFIWDYNDIAGDSYSIGTAIEIANIGVELCWDFDTDTLDMTGIIFAFEFSDISNAIFSLPLSLSWSNVDTILYDLSDYIGLYNENEIEIENKNNELNMLNNNNSNNNNNNSFNLNKFEIIGLIILSCIIIIILYIISCGNLNCYLKPEDLGTYEMIV